MHRKVQDPGPKEEPEVRFVTLGCSLKKRKNDKKTDPKENLNIIMRKHVIKS